MAQRDFRPDGDRSLRSVFVGNVPYDATEEKLKEVFSEVGPVVSFRLVYDRETGKPKGYGFCEYRDTDTAMSAMRNINNRELNGRTLRVDNAANERTREEFRSLQTSEKGSFESPYGADVDPEKAPEAISQVVASLPPEQLFELTSQMTHCIQTNPHEARNLLLQNPQLAYAMLQALVIMGAVDPLVAVNTLHRGNPPPQVLRPPENAPGIMHHHQPQHVPQHVVHQQQFPDYTRHVPPLPQVPQVVHHVAPPVPPQTVHHVAASKVDPRVAHRQQQQQHVPYTVDPRRTHPAVQHNPAPVRDPRLGASSSPVNVPTGGGHPSPSLVQEQEKAAVIMQVLQLTDHEINLLPPEQRQSILLLKDSIARNAQ